MSGISSTPSSRPEHNYRHPDRRRRTLPPQWRDPRIFFPRKPQQNRVSSPSTLQSPPNPHPTNHLPPKNSWHTSYVPSGKIEVVERSKRPQSRQPMLTGSGLFPCMPFSCLKGASNGPNSTQTALNPRSNSAHPHPLRTESAPITASTPRQPRRELQSLDDFTGNSHG